MTDLTEQRLREMMESLGAKPNENPATLEEKVGAFYRSFTDEARVEQLGAKAIESELSALKDAKTRDDFAALMGRTTTDFEFSLFNPMIDADLKDPQKIRLLSDPGGNRSARSRLLSETGFRRPEERLPKLCRHSFETVELA